MGKNKLFLLPHAGGSAKGYMVMKHFFDASGLELVPLELAGRSSRIKEPCITDVQTCVEDLYTILKQQIDDCNYGIFGHSLGAMLGYELIRYIEQQKVKGPSCGIFSGRVAPDCQFPGPFLSQLEDKTFLKKFNALQALPNEVLINQSIQQLVLPILRADVKMTETYQYQGGRKLKCDLYIFYGKDDVLTNEEGLKGWNHMTDGKVEFTEFLGDHFYYKEHVVRFTERIQKIMTLYGQ